MGGEEMKTLILLLLSVLFTGCNHEETSEHKKQMENLAKHAFDAGVKCGLTLTEEQCQEVFERLIQ